MSAMRAIPLALGLLLGATASPAAEAGVPAIFSDVPPRAGPYKLKLGPPPLVRAPLPLSPQVRAALTERMREAAPAVAPRPAKRTWLDDTGDAILMDKVVVLEHREKKIVVESVPGYLARAFTTGTLWESKDDSKSVNWGLGAVRQQAYGSQSTAPRIQLSFSWRW